MMKEIVKVLLQEGIDEDVIHEVLSVIEEKYEIVDEDSTSKYILKNAKKNIKKLKGKIRRASQEFDHAYAEMQQNPNINLHPYAEKEGNLRIEKDREEERLSKVK